MESPIKKAKRCPGESLEVIRSTKGDIHRLRDVWHPSKERVEAVVRSLLTAIDDSISCDVSPLEFTDAIYALEDLDQLIGNQLRVVDGGFLDLRMELDGATRKVKQYLDLHSDGSPSCGYPIELFNSKVGVLDKLVKESYERERKSFANRGRMKTERNKNLAALELKHFVQFLRKDGSHFGNIYDDDFQKWKKVQIEAQNYPNEEVQFHIL